MECDAVQMKILHFEMLVQSRKGRIFHFDNHGDGKSRAVATSIGNF